MPNGIGIDRAGGPVIDPTENVLSLVDVEKAHARELRSSDQNLRQIMRDADQRYQEQVSTSEARRINDLAILRATYERQISDMLSVQVKTTSDLISTQLDKVTTALGAQITTLTAATQSQLQTLSATLSSRLDQVERWRYEVGGRTSVTDPATSSALHEMAQAIATLRMTDDRAEGKGIGQAAILGYGFGLIGVAVAVVTLILKH